MPLIIDSLGKFKAYIHSFPVDTCIENSPIDISTDSNNPTKISLDLSSLPDGIKKANYVNGFQFFFHFLFNETYNGYNYLHYRIGTSSDLQNATYWLSTYNRGPNYYNTTNTAYVFYNTGSSVTYTYQYIYTQPPDTLEAWFYADYEGKQLIGYAVTAILLKGEPFGKYSSTIMLSSNYTKTNASSSPTVCSDFTQSISYYGIGGGQQDQIPWRYGLPNVRGRFVDAGYATLITPPPQNNTYTTTDYEIIYRPPMSYILSHYSTYNSSKYIYLRLPYEYEIEYFIIDTAFAGRR